MHHEKTSQESNVDKNSKFAHPHRQSPYFLITNLLSIFPKIQRFIAEPSILTFGSTMPSVITFEMILLRLTSSLLIHKRPIFSPKYLDLLNITSAPNSWD